MAEPFKNELGQSRIECIAHHLSKSHPRFPKADFLAHCLLNLDELSLMERNRQIASGLQRYLPSDFSEACDLLEQSLSPFDQQEDRAGLHSWLTIPLCEYVGRESHHNLPRALNCFENLTGYFSAEWGIRHILSDRYEQALEQLLSWTSHQNEHVRRLASEGSRPRLPWGIQLKNVIDDPNLTFQILDNLKDDSSEYVRKSVANHLNDYSKDHPDWLVKKIAPWWKEKGVSENRRRMIRHGLRTLIKAGHKPTLDLLGYKAVTPKQVTLKLEKQAVAYGEALNLILDLELSRDSELILDYAIHFKKANGTLAPKVFKWKVFDLKGDRKTTLKKRHAIKPITTRRYYDGEHGVEILLNGESIAYETFQLTGVGD